jgi:hypothetical protein
LFVDAIVFGALAFAEVHLPPFVTTEFAAFIFLLPVYDGPFSFSKPYIDFPGPTNAPPFDLSVFVYIPASLAPLASRRAPPLQ